MIDQQVIFQMQVDKPFLDMVYNMKDKVLIHVIMIVNIDANGNGTLNTLEMDRIQNRNEARLN